MSIASGLIERLKGRRGVPGLERDGALPLRWRRPWYVWQTTSWLIATLIAPPFAMIGILLAVNPRSDQPLFWLGTMIVVAAANAAAIVLSNQRHYRSAFVTRAAVARCYFIVGFLSAAALFLLLVWGTDALEILVDPLVSARHAPGHAALAVWAIGLAAAFGVSSSAHASILHPWLAFKP